MTKKKKKVSIFKLQKTNDIDKTLNPREKKTLPEKEHYYDLLSKTKQLCKQE